MSALAVTRHVAAHFDATHSYCGAPAPFVQPASESETCRDCLATMNCAEHDPNSGPGSDWCPNCGGFAFSPPRDR